jgi:hypothetical protein
MLADWTGRRHTDRARSFVQYKQCTPKDNRSSRCSELTLSDRQVCLTRRDGAVQRERVLGRASRRLGEANHTEDVVQHHIVVLVEQVWVPVECAWKELRLSGRSFVSYDPQTVQ